MSMRTRSDAGFLEIILIAALILLFGATTFTLVSAGGDAYDRLLEQRDIDITLRVALSYITTQLRQNDIAAAVQVRDGVSGEYLTLRRESGGEVYETRIYLDSGWLKEVSTFEDLPFDPESGSPITQLTGFTCRYVDSNETALLLTVTAGEGEDARSQQTVVAVNAVGRQS